MAVIFYELVQFISADVKGVIVVQKGTMPSPLLCSDGLQCSSALSGQFNSQHI